MENHGTVLSPCFFWLTPEIIIMGKSTLEPKAEKNHNKYSKCYPSIFCFGLSILHEEEFHYVLSYQCSLLFVKRKLINDRFRLN